MVGRIADPVGFYPDPDPTFKEKPDPIYEKKPDLYPILNLPYNVHLLLFSFDIKSM